MSDFVQTMKDWRRMCKAFTTNNECCDGCPIMALEIDEHGCDAIFSEWADKADWDEVEDVIETWAAGHQEPVYPTWYELLNHIGVLGTAAIGAGYVSERLCTMHIPADIAQKLGLQPKEC